MNFKREDIAKRFNDFLDEIEKMQIEIAQELGETCVAHARMIPKEQGFEDQTGNLRSSIGYAVFKDGIAIHISYQQVLQGSEGEIKGEGLAKKVGSRLEGIALVVTAGMNYAVHVEAKGRDVISSAEHLAEKELPRMLQALTSDIKQVV